MYKKAVILGRSSLVSIILANAYLPILGHGKGHSLVDCRKRVSDSVIEEQQAWTH